MAKKPWRDFFDKLNIGRGTGMETTKTFQELGVSEEILRALEKKGVAMPTRVQEEAIPPLLAWRDVIA